RQEYAGAFRTARRASKPMSPMSFLAALGETVVSVSRWMFRQARSRRTLGVPGASPIYRRPLPNIKLRSLLGFDRIGRPELGSRMISILSGYTFPFGSR